MADPNLIEPVYFMNSSLIDNQIKEFEICTSMEKVLDKSSIRGCQKIKNTWRLYVAKPDSRITLLQHGLDIRQQHIDLFDSNPASQQQMSR